MDVIVLTIFGFLLLGFISYWTFRHRGKADAFLENNQNVMPLLRERSAQIKYDELTDVLANDPNALQVLEKLKQDYTDGLITVEAYEEELTVLQEQHINR